MNLLLSSECVVCGGRLSWFDTHLLKLVVVKDNLFMHRKCQLMLADGMLKEEIIRLRDVTSRFQIVGLAGYNASDVEYAKQFETYNTVEN